tara:strand:+ start:253 stop:711 length:459 start_codon:yes stop_codon:yes gene_type:complete
VLIKKFESRAHIEGFEELLSDYGIFAKTEGGEIDEGFRIVDRPQKFSHLGRHASTDIAFECEEAGEFRAKILGFDGIFAGSTPQGANADEPVRFIASDIRDFCTAKSLEEKIGSAVVVFLARANDADGGDTVGWFEGTFVVNALLIEPCDRE